MSRYIYETKDVKSGRTDKWCDVCSKTIKKGKSSITIVCFSDEFYNQTVCNSKCEKKFRKDFNEEE